jgi:hypothetical protein
VEHIVPADHRDHQPARKQAAREVTRQPVPGFVQRLHGTPLTQLNSTLPGDSIHRQSPWKRNGKVCEMTAFAQSYVQSVALKALGNSAIFTGID